MQDIARNPGIVAIALALIGLSAVLFFVGDNKSSRLRQDSVIAVGRDRQLPYFLVGFVALVAGTALGVGVFSGVL